MHRLAVRSISSARVTFGSRRATLVFGISCRISLEYVLTPDLIPDVDVFREQESGIVDIKSDESGKIVMMDGLDWIIV